MILSNAALINTSLKYITEGSCIVLQFGVAEEKMMEKLWGDNFFDPATKKWSKKPTTSATCKCAQPLTLALPFPLTRIFIHHLWHEID